MPTRKDCLWWLVVALGCALVSLAHGQDHSALKPLLIDLPNWEGDNAESMSIDVEGVKMISATRSYSNDDGDITVMLLIGNQAMAQEKTEDLKAETEDGKVVVSEVDGFQVQLIFDKTDKSGGIIVVLNQGEKGSSMFSFEFDGIDDKEAMALARKFDWQKMKAETAKLL